MDSSPVRIALYALLALAVASCESMPWSDDGYNEVDSANDVGSLRVAVLSVGRWSEYVDKLSPAFGLESGKAYQQAVQDSRRLLEKSLRIQSFRGKASFSGMGGLGDATEGAQTESPSAPEFDDAAGDRTASDLPEPKDFLSGGVEINAMLRYQLATALQQEVTLLEKYIADANIGGGYEPFLVRLQVGLMPNTRSLPYDAFLSLSFFHRQDVAAPACSEPKECTPRVLPLLVTDNLEATLHAAASNDVRDLAFALGGAFKGVALETQYQDLLDRLEAVVGRDLNSLLTVGRLSENSVRIRLGAMQAVLSKKHRGKSAAGFVMVPRTQYVTLVVLVPKTWTEPNASQTHVPLDLYTFSEFYDVRNGKELPGRSARKTQRMEGSILEEWGLPTGRRGRRLLNELWVETLNSNFQAFRAILDHYCTAPDGKVRRNPCLDDGRFALPAQFWNDLVRRDVGVRNDVVTFEVPRRRAQKPFPDQLALVVDDGASTSQVTLVGAQGLASSGTCAQLRLGAGNAERVPSSRATVVQSGALATFDFPSLKSWGLQSEAAAKRGELRVAWGDSLSQCWQNIDDARSSHRYTLGGYRLAPKKDPPQTFLLSFTTGRIVATTAGTGDMLMELKPQNPDGAKKVKVEFGGADVARVAKLVPGAPGSESTEQVVVGQPTTAFTLDLPGKYKVYFRNLAAGSKLSLKVADVLGGRPEEKQLDVVASPAQVAVTRPEPKRTGGTP